MKINKIISALALALSIGAVSCNEDLAEAPVPAPEGGVVGLGTWDNPMTAAQVLAGFANDSIAQPWATGYIVGYVDTNVSGTMSEATAVVDPELIQSGKATVATNMLITSKDPNAEGVVVTWEDCATVQLPSGPLRNALNLRDNPDNYGKLVTLRGTTGVKYCGVYGIRTVVDYEWGDKGKEPGPDDRKPEPYLYQGFDTSTELSSYKDLGWKVLTVSGSILGWGIATEGSQNYMVASAYNAPEERGPYQCWLVSPAVDLDQSMEKTLSFRMRASYQTPGSSMEAWLMVEDKPVRQLDLNLPAAPADGYGEWATTKVDLSSQEGVIRVAWRYYAERGGSDCTAYGLDNVNIGGAPELIYSGLDGAAASINWTYQNENLGGLPYIWTWYERDGGHYLYGTAFVSGSGSHEALAYAISPVVDLSGMTRLRVQFEHAASYQRNIRQLCGLMIREAGQTEWTQLEIPNWPKAGTWDFSDSGEIDLSDYEGKQVQFAFKYASTAQNADSWEIRNFQVTGKSK